MLLNCGVGEDPESPLDCKEIQPVNPKGNQPWIFTGRTDTEAKAPILWPWEERTHLKRPDAGKDWKQEEKGTTEDEMVGWHHWLNGHEFEQALGDGEEQGNMACCSPWVTRSRTGLSNWTTTSIFSPKTAVRSHLSSMNKPLKFAQWFLLSWLDPLTWVAWVVAEYSSPVHPFW